MNTGYIMKVNFGPKVFLLKSVKVSRVCKNKSLDEAAERSNISLNHSIHNRIKVIKMSMVVLCYGHLQSLNAIFSRSFCNAISITRS